MKKQNFIICGIIFLLLAIIPFVVQAKETKNIPITINIYYTGENGNARKFAEEMEQSGTVALIRAEEGNLKYEYFYPKNDPETVLLIDSWESQEAIDKHHTTPMMDKIFELRNKYDLHMKVERYIEEKTISQNDLNYIKE